MKKSQLTEKRRGAYGGYAIPTRKAKRGGWVSADYLSTEDNQ
ncbi:MAG: hypothetical protein PHI98_14870 [Eubacteriales bacterium]|nr:hypothetical protein [Eubacteriales bacterium]